MPKTLMAPPEEMDEKEKAAWLVGMKRGAGIAANFTVGPNARIHPDIPWDKMNAASQNAAHTTAQQIAMAIFEAAGINPFSGQPLTPEDLEDEDDEADR